MTQTSLTLTLCCRHLNSWLAQGRLPAARPHGVGSAGIKVTYAQAVGGVELMVDLPQKLVGVKGAGNVALPSCLPARTLDSGNVVLMIFIATGSRRLGQITSVTPLQTKGALVAGSVGLVAEAVKLPVRSRAVGTMAPLRNVLVVWRSPE